MKPKVRQLLRMLDAIASNLEAFQELVEKRIALFTPPGVPIHLDGYFVAARDGGGYAFGGTDFFLNIGIVDDLVLARSTTTHEMYHAMQGAFARQRGGAKGTDHATLACAEIGRLFENLYEEGSAMCLMESMETGR